MASCRYHVYLRVRLLSCFNSLYLLCERDNKMAAEENFKNYGKDTEEPQWKKGNNDQFLFFVSEISVKIR